VQALELAPTFLCPFTFLRRKDALGRDFFSPRRVLRRPPPFAGFFRHFQDMN